MQTQQRARHAASSKAAKIYTRRHTKKCGDEPGEAEAVRFILGDSCGPQRHRASHQRETGDRIKKPIRHTGEYGPNGAKTATQSDMGVDLGDSPGHANERGGI
jgi:hypothetical protein